MLCFAWTGLRADTGRAFSDLVLLSGIYSASDLGKDLALKGGNCFRKAYFRRARFSNDLDFAAERELPAEEREVVMLRHYTSMSFAEIAEAMGTPLGTALARSHRGLAKLRTWMEEDA